MRLRKEVEMITKEQVMRLQKLGLIRPDSTGESDPVLTVLRDRLKFLILEKVVREASFTDKLPDMPYGILVHGGPGGATLILEDKDSGCDDSDDEERPYGYGKPGMHTNAGFETVLDGMANAQDRFFEILCSIPGTKGLGLSALIDDFCDKCSVYKEAEQLVAEEGYEDYVDYGIDPVGAAVADALQSLTSYPVNQQMIDGCVKSEDGKVKKAATSVLEKAVGLCTNSAELDAVTCALGAYADRFSLRWFGSDDDTILSSGGLFISLALKVPPSFYNEDGVNSLTYTDGGIRFFTVMGCSFSYDALSYNGSSAGDVLSTKNLCVAYPVFTEIFAVLGLQNSK